MNQLEIQPSRPASSLPVPASPPPSAGLDFLIGEVLFLCFRNKWKILLCFLLGAGAAAHLWYKTPVVYRSEARLLVRYIADRTTSEPMDMVGRVTSPDSRGANIINSEIGILTSRDLVEKVVDEMGESGILGSADPTGDAKAAAIRNVESNMIAQNPRNSNLIHVSFDAASPSLAQDVLTRITRFYLDKHVGVHQSGLGFDFLLQQTDQVAARLAATERELQAARAEVDVGDIDTAKENTRLRIAEMNTQLFLIDTQLAATQARLETLGQQSVDRGALPPPAGDSTAVPADPETVTTVAMLTSRLRRLRESEMTLLSTYTDQSPAVQNVRREIARVEEEWRQKIGMLPARDASGLIPNSGGDVAAMAARIGNASLDAMTDLAALTAQRTVILRHLEDARQTALKIENAEAIIRRLQRRREIEEANYLYFSKNLEQARINTALDSSKITNINVIQRATLPLKGFRPELFKRIGMALGGGLIAGLALAFILENGFHSRWFVRPRDVPAALGLPVLVTIPCIPRRLRKSRQAARAISVGATSGIWTTPEGFLPYCERLRHRMLLSSLVSRKPVVLGVTGCSHRSGISTLASGLAMAIAREGATRVLLTHASLQGAAEVSVNEQGRITVTDWSRTVIEGGDEADSLPEAGCTATRFQSLLSRMDAGIHGCVVLDLPPVLEDSRSLSVAPFLDSLVLIIKSEKDRKEVARSCVDLFREAKAPVSGIVFNQYRRYVPVWLSNES